MAITKFRPAEMRQHHADCKDQLKWLPFIEARDKYQIGATELRKLCEIYSIPTMTLDNRKTALVSVPCLEKVLICAKELHSTTSEDSAKQRHEKMAAEAEATARREMIEEFKSKLQTA